MIFKTMIPPLPFKKSRRDGILLTGGFNRRNETRHATSLQSPAGTAYYTCHICRPFGTWALFLAFFVRRLKPILLYIFLVSCTGNTSLIDNNISDIIDLTVGLNNIQTVRLSEIADSVSFIPFETNPQSVMGQALRNIEFTPQHIFYFNKYFDWSGKYLGAIGRQGKGPYEEPEGVFNVIYKDNYFYSKGSKFIEYDIIGKPTGKIRNLYSAREFGDNDFLRSADSFITVGEYFVVYDTPITLYYLNDNFETVQSRVVFQTDIPPARTFHQGIGNSKYITYYKDNILFYNFINDTIFYLTDSGLKPQWIVNFDDPLRLPAEVIMNSTKLTNDLMKSLIRKSSTVENSDLVRLTDGKLKVGAVYETDSYLFFFISKIFYYATSRGKQPASYIVIFNKNTGNLKKVERGFIDDLLGMGFFFPKVGIYDEKMISFIWPFELFDYIEDYKERGREVNPQLVALSKKVKADDNPILILVHLKK